MQKVLLHTMREKLLKALSGYNFVWGKFKFEVILTADHFFAWTNVGRISISDRSPFNIQRTSLRILKLRDFFCFQKFLNLMIIEVNFETFSCFIMIFWSLSNRQQTDITTLSNLYSARGNLDKVTSHQNGAIPFAAFQSMTSLETITSHPTSAHFCS